MSNSELFEAEFMQSLGFSLGVGLFGLFFFIIALALAGVEFVSKRNIDEHGQSNDN